MIHSPRTVLILSRLRWLLFCSTVLLLVSCNRQQAPEAETLPASVRVLLITQENRLFQHDIQVIQGAAHGYPNRVGQWMAVVLDENRQPLADFGIPDPRLILEHQTAGAVWLPIDSETSYLFDVVVPLNYEPENTTALNVLPRIVQIVDEAKTILFEVDLTPAIDTYCQDDGLGVRTADCQDRTFPLADVPPPPGGITFPNPLTPREERPEATTDLDQIFPFPPVELCIAKDQEITRITRMDRLEFCDILPLEIACATQDFEPGVEFAVDESVDGQSWRVDALALSTDGESSYTGAGIRFGPGSTFSLVTDDCLLTSIELSLQPVQQSATERRLVTSGGHYAAFGELDEMNGAISAPQLGYLSAPLPMRAQPAQPGAPSVTLMNLGREIADQQALPLGGSSTLRINALPLNNQIQLAVQGGSVIVDRIRVNMAVDLGEEAPGAPAISTPAETSTADVTLTTSPTRTLTRTPTGAPTRTATSTPRNTATSTQTPQPTVTPTVTPTPEPLCIVVVNALNLRNGPGTVYAPPIGSYARGAQLLPFGRNVASTWIVVQQRGDETRGWVNAGAQYVDCNFDIGTLPVVTPPPTPTATSTPTFTPTPTLRPRPVIEVGADPNPISRGGCTTVWWEIRNVEAVYYEGRGVSGSGRESECPEETRAYSWRIVTADGELYREVVVEVIQPILDPSLTIAPYSGEIGTTHQLTFREFRPNEVVDLDVQFGASGQVVYRTTIQMDQAGNGTFSLTSEQSDAGGQYAVTARGRNGSVARAIFEIIAEPPGSPDLVIQLDDFEVDCFSTGNGVACNLTVYFTIRNIGTGDATQPFAVFVEGDAVPAGRSSFNYLAAGASQSASITLGPGGNCYNPDCTVTVTVDVTDAIDELNEQNNSDTSTGLG